MKIKEIIDYKFCKYICYTNNKYIYFSKIDNLQDFYNENGEYLIVVAVRKSKITYKIR